MRWVAFLLTVSCVSAALLMAEQPSSETNSVANRVQAGTLVYQAHCAMCHSVLPGATLVGPSLHGEMKGPAAASVRTIILNGKGKMRGLKGQMTPQELNNLLAYLKTLS
jgi:mono/diheme cytochrome c family protein